MRASTISHSHLNESQYLECNTGRNHWLWSAIVGRTLEVGGWNQCHEDHAFMKRTFIESIMWGLWNVAENGQFRVTRWWRHKNLICENLECIEIVFIEIIAAKMFLAKKLPPVGVNGLNTNNHEVRDRYLHIWRIETRISTHVWLNLRWRWKKRRWTKNENSLKLT